MHCSVVTFTLVIHVKFLYQLILLMTLAHSLIYCAPAAALSCSSAANAPLVLSAFVLLGMSLSFLAGLPATTVYGATS